MSKNLLKAGVTSWLPTTLTGSFDQLNEVCKTIAAHAGDESGAKIQGIYFEGPYFTTKHKGHRIRSTSKIQVSKNTMLGRRPLMAC